MHAPLMNADTFDRHESIRCLLRADRAAVSERTSSDCIFRNESDRFCHRRGPRPRLSEVNAACPGSVFRLWGLSSARRDIGGARFKPVPHIAGRHNGPFRQGRRDGHDEARGSPVAIREESPPKHKASTLPRAASKVTRSHHPPSKCSLRLQGRLDISMNKDNFRLCLLCKRYPRRDAAGQSSGLLL